jgi:putative glutamine amidotransferase
VRVQSHHHQAADELGEGVVASGWSVADDLVEAIELPERRFALGVLWHPEVDAGSGIVDAFVRAARSTGAARGRAPSGAAHAH